MSFTKLLPYWPYLALLLVGLFGGLEYAKNQQNEAANKANAILLATANDSLKKLGGRIAADTLPLARIHDTVTKVVTKIRTLVLTKIDSGLAEAQAAMALVPPSDTACRKALNALLTPCEQARAQVVADTALFKSIGDTVQAVKQREAQHAVDLARASQTLDSVTKAYTCRIKLVLVSLGCPSRSAVGFVGAGLGAVVTLLVKH